MSRNADNYRKTGHLPKTIAPLGFLAKTHGALEWARQDLNLQPTDYESAALTELSYGPEIFFHAYGLQRIMLSKGLHRR